MRHVVMVIGKGNSKILQETVNLLDDCDVDFYICWDKRCVIPDIYSYHSNIYFLNDIKFNWGSYSEILAEKEIINLSLKSKKKYDFFHLIDSNDYPLMDLKHFKNFFSTKPFCLGFVDFVEQLDKIRMKQIYPIGNLKLLNHYYLGSIYVKLINIINLIFRINRIKHYPIEKGTPYFSMERKYVDYINNSDNLKFFKNTLNGKEFYAQTILKHFKSNSANAKYNYYSINFKMNKSSVMASRYIDYVKGKRIDWYRYLPYVFTSSDLGKLRKVANTKYAFVHTIDNANTAKKIFNYKI